MLPWCRGRGFRLGFKACSHFASPRMREIRLPDAVTATKCVKLHVAAVAPGGENTCSAVFGGLQLLKTLVPQCLAASQC